MRLGKKFFAVLAALCMTLSLSMTAFAANGELMFTDPQTAVGQTVEVKGVVEVDPSLGLEDMTINLTYDTTMLKFNTAEEVTETEPGKLTFSRIGVENPNRVEYLMYFEAIAEGETVINVADCNIWTTTDEKVYPVLGSSKVTIEAGELVEEPVEEPTEEPVEGPTDDIVINISNTTSITLIDEISHITLPQRYLATTITVNGIEYPAWQDTEKANFCILYALNSYGEEALYQYDTNEGTYQRFEAPATDEKEDKESVISVLSGLFEDNMDYVVLGVGIGFLLFVVIIIVLSIKLYNRNAELDELYEEYGLYEEEEEKEKVAEKVAKVEKPAEPKIVKVIPVTKKEKEEFIDIKDVTEDDIVITADEDDEEIEVEFYEAEPEVKPEVKAEAPVEVAKAPEKETKAAPVKEEEFYDDDLDLDFEIDFIDLDD